MGVLLLSPFWGIGLAQVLDHSQGVRPSLIANSATPRCDLQDCRLLSADMAPERGERTGEDQTTTILLWANAGTHDVITYRIDHETGERICTATSRELRDPALFELGWLFSSKNHEIVFDTLSGWIEARTPLSVIADGALVWLSSQHGFLGGSRSLVGVTHAVRDLFQPRRRSA